GALCPCRCTRPLGRAGNRPCGRAGGAPAPARAALSEHGWKPRSSPPRLIHVLRTPPGRSIGAVPQAAPVQFSKAHLHTELNANAALPTTDVLTLQAGCLVLSR